MPSDIVIQDEAERRKLIEQLFLKTSTTNDTPTALGGSTTLVETEETKKKVFLHPITTTTFDTHLSTPSSFPRLILKLHPKSVLFPLLNIRVSPRTIVLPGAAASVKDTDTSDVSAATLLSQKSSPFRQSSRSTSSARQPHSSTPHATKNKACHIEQSHFSDSPPSVSLSTIKTLQNADWTCDGKLVVLCGKQGLLLADVSSMLFVTLTTGEYNRVACHPTLPTVFAALLSSNSLIIYEIHERPNMKSNHPSYIMKITAEIKFTSVNLSNTVLSWSPFGNFLIICNNDKGLYLLAFEDIAQPTGQMNTSDDSLVAFQQLACRTQRPRRSLRIVAQGKFEGKITCAQFGYVHSNTFYDPTQATLNPYVEEHLVKQASSASLMIYIALESGALFAYHVDTTLKHFTDASKKSPFNFTEHVKRLNVGVEVTSFDIDPSLSRFLALGGADDSLHIWDVSSNVVIGVHHRIGAPMSQVALSGGGLFVAWSPQLISLPGGHTHDWLDTLRLPQTHPYVGLSFVGKTLEFLWKCNIPATITCLRWHPWKPALLVVYDTNARLGTAYHNSLTGLTWESFGGASSPQNSSSVMILHFT